MVYTYEADKWVRLETTVVGNKATAMVTHFSTFVLFDEVPPTPTPTPIVTPTPTPIVTPTPPVETPTPEPLGFEAVFAIAGLLAVAYLVLRRREKR